MLVFVMALLVLQLALPFFAATAVSSPDASGSAALVP